MPVLIVWLVEALVSVIGQLIVAALIYLGISLATSEVAAPALRDMFAGYWSGLPIDIATGLAYINVDKAITIILAALLARQAGNAGKVFLKRKRA